MSFLTKIIISILANSAAIWAADRLVPGFSFRGDLTDLIIAGAVLGLINALIKPLVKLLTCPIILLTLGLFTIIINVALLNLASHWLPSLSINGFWAAVWGVIVISLVNHLVFLIFPKDQKGEN